MCRPTLGVTSGLRRTGGQDPLVRDKWGVDVAGTCTDPCSISTNCDSSHWGPFATTAALICEIMLSISTMVRSLQRRPEHGSKSLFLAVQTLTDPRSTPISYQTPNGPATPNHTLLLSNQVGLLYCLATAWMANPIM